MNKNIWIICQYASPIKYGFGTRHYYLAEEWKKKGYNVTIITSAFQHVIHTNPPNKKLFNLETDDEINSLWIKGLKYKNSSGIGRILSWFYFMFLLFFIPYKKLNKPNIIIVSSMSLLPMINAFFYKKKFKAQLILEIRDIWPLTITEIGGYSKNNPLVWTLQKIEKFAYKNADYITATMPKADLHIKKMVKKNFKFKCIPQGINLEFVSKQEKLEIEFISKYIPENKFIVGYAGTIGISNALESLIEASQKLERINPNIHFLILGDGPLKESFIEKTKVNSNITFISKISKYKVNHFLQFCDVLYDSAKNSKLYDFGLSRNKWMDYMLSGKPIIASYSGFKSLINEANCGSFVPAENVPSLIDEILKYYNKSKEELTILGQNGKKYIVNHRSFEILANEYERIFQIDKVD